MKNIEEILIEVNKGNLKFHWRSEKDLYKKALIAFLNKDFLSSASLSAVLYEMIFTTKLIRELANPIGFIPNKENLEQQLDNLKNSENKITNEERLGFKEITKKLVQLNVISSDQKDSYDKIYNEIRNPILHALNLRLFKQMLDREPKNIFEVDTEYESYYKIAAEKMIEEIYEIVSKQILIKK